MYYVLLGIFFLSSCCCVSNAGLTKDYTAVVKSAVCRPSDYMRYPETENDVVAIVKEAIQKNVTVKAIGSRHSITDIICTQGIPVEMRKLKSFKMNDDGTATFGAGVTLREATTFLRKYKRAFRTTPAFGNITIGGAIGTGAHGSSIKYNASISSQVVAVRIVDGMGNLRDISDPKELQSFRIHLGLLGIVVKATIYTVPLYKTYAHNVIMSDSILTNGEAIKMAQESDQISIYWFPAFNEVVVSKWTIVDESTKGTAYTNDHVPSTYDNFNLVAALAKEVASTLTSSTCRLANKLGYTILHVFEYYTQLSLIQQTVDFTPIYTEDGYHCQNPAVGYYDEMFAPICHDKPQGLLGAACPWAHGPNNLTFLDNEFGFKLTDLAAFVKDMRDIQSKAPLVFPMIGILLRFSDASDIYMSTAYGEQTVHFEYYMLMRNELYHQPSASLAGFQTILQTLQHKYKARSHWGKSGLAYHDTPSLDLKLNPFAREQFVATMSRYDPNGIFMNKFGRRLKKKGTASDIDSEVTRCALLDNCICSSDSDCGENQECTTLPGYDYFVCQTKNEEPEGTVNKSDFKQSIGLLTYILQDVPNLVRSLLGKCPLDDALFTVLSTIENAAVVLLQGAGNRVETLLEGVTSTVVKGDVSGLLGTVTSTIVGTGSTVLGILGMRG